MDDEYVPAPAKSGIYYADALTLYGVKLNSQTDYGTFSIGQGDYELQSQLFRTNATTGKLTAVTRANYSIALTYGYGFEGHCYRLDCQRIFIIIGPGDEDPVGCGFDLQQSPPLDARYRMWRIRSSTELLEISTTFGDAKTLILDANLPGKKSPTSYAINLMAAHRNGRLTRD